jgi:hypothetical protein
LPQYRNDWPAESDERKAYVQENAQEIPKIASR